MDFDLKSIEMFIPKNQTLLEAIKGDYRLMKRTLYYSKMYKKAFSKLSVSECTARGRKMAYAEYILKHTDETLANL